MPMIKPEVGDRIMRDPSLCYVGGTFHLVWTSSWGNTGASSLGFGHAASSDLQQWSKQQFVPVRHARDDAVNVWAPELLCQADGTATVIFASMFRGSVQPKGPARYACEHMPQHLFAVTTSDFQTWSRPVELHPGPPVPASPQLPSTLSAIDATILELPGGTTRARNGSYLLVYKDERLGVKALRAALGATPLGPFAPLTAVGGWDALHCVEGPTAFLSPRRGGGLYIAYDRYRVDDCAHFCAGVAPFYGLLRCKLPARGALRCKDVTRFAAFPRQQRHGAVVAVPRERLRGLLQGFKSNASAAEGGGAVEASSPAFFCSGNRCPANGTGSTS